MNLSWWCLWILNASGLWPRVVWNMVTNISKDPASPSSIYLEDGRNRFLRNVTIHQTILHRITENNNFVHEQNVTSYIHYNLSTCGNNCLPPPAKHCHVRLYLTDSARALYTLVIRKSNELKIIKLMLTILWYQSRKRQPLLGNGSLNTFPQEPIHVSATTNQQATIEGLLVNKHTATRDCGSGGSQSRQAVRYGHVLARASSSLWTGL
jgi:hypothetical protein